jgi:hypothetical protein
MVENRFNLGPYEVILDCDDCDVVTNDNIAVIKIKDHPDINMFVSKVPRRTDRDVLWRDTVINDTSGTIWKMLDISTSSMAAISDVKPKILVGGRPGFSVSVANQGLTAYRVGYWLEGDDAISVFASSPNGSTLKNEIIDILTNHIKVNRA